MIEALTITENSVARPDTGKFSEAKEAPRGEKQAEKQPITFESSQMSELVADIKNEMIPLFQLYSNPIINYPSFISIDITNLLIYIIMYVPPTYLQIIFVNLFTNIFLNNLG